MPEAELKTRDWKRRHRTI